MTPDHPDETAVEDAVEPLPDMDQLRALSAELDEIDATLARLDDGEPTS